MNRRIYGFTLSLAVLLGGIVPLQAQDKDEAARREEVARQKLEKDIAELVKQADRLKDKPKEALVVLEKAAKLLKETNIPLGLSRRSELENGIEAKVKAYKNAPVTLNPPPPPMGTGRDDDFQQQLIVIRELQKQGRDAEARALADKLNKQYPNRSTSALTQGSSAMAHQAREQDQVSRAKADGQRSTFLEIDKSAANIPPDGVYAGPDKETRERQKNRKGIFAETLTANEKALLRQLDEVSKEPIQFKDMPFDQVVKYLQDNLGLPLQVGKATLDEVQLDYSRPINISLPRGTSKRTILMRILNDLDLAYVIKNEQLVVMSAQRAAKEVVTKPYYVRDLRGHDLHKLAAMIQDSIEPTSWRKAGGPGHIVVDDRGILFITNTAEIIGRIVGYNK